MSRSEVPPAVTVHCAIAEQVSARADSPAVCCGIDEITYGELERRASGLARALRASGVEPGDVVAIDVPRGIDLVVAMCAVLKTGGCMLLLDERWPHVRRREAVARAGVHVLVGDDDSLGVTRLQVPAFDAFDSFDWFDAVEPPPQAAAYVIFTSGSTGRPKGVVCTHEGVLGLARWNSRRFDVVPGSRVGSLASVAFDAFHWEVWSTLVAGATLVVAPSAVMSEARTTATWLVASGVHHAFVPTAIAAEVWSVLADLPGGAGDLRQLVTGGDRLVLDVVPGRHPALANAYGPSECSVVATCGDVTRSSIRDRRAAIGEAIDGVAVRLLSDELRAARVGDAADIYVAGRGVGLGYLDGARETADRFVPDPFGAGGRMYRTGDIGCIDDDQLWFLGRDDRQIQLNGVRLEPAEVEAAARDSGLVSDCRVDTVQNNQTGRDLLRARCLVQVASPSVPSELRAALGRVLPSALVPGVIEVASSLAATEVGKWDWDSFVAVETGLAGVARNPDVSPPDDLAAVAAAIWASSLGLDEHPSTQEDFFSLGGDSLAALEIANELETVLGREVRFDLVFAHPTFGDFVGAVRMGGL